MHQVAILTLGGLHPLEVFALTITPSYPASRLMFDVFISSFGFIWREC